jgi:hypothetical protein
VPGFTGKLAFKSLPQYCWKIKKKGEVYQVRLIVLQQSIWLFFPFSSFLDSNLKFSPRRVQPGGRTTAVFYLFRTNIE